jgi:uncharacterized protein YdhG (YjbR/CyaY superfamily)
MKRAKSGKRSSAAKGKRSSVAKSSKPPAKRKALPKTVDEYLARVPEPARSALNQMRAAIRSETPADATEVISYGIPAFKHGKMLVWYAAFSEHCSLFPGSSVIEAFKDDLKGFSTSKGTIHFPMDKPVPTVLIKKLVKARVAENQSKERR